MQGRPQKLSKGFRKVTSKSSPKTRNKFASLEKVRKFFGSSLWASNQTVLTRLVERRFPKDVPIPSHPFSVTGIGFMFPKSFASGETFVALQASSYYEYFPFFSPNIALMLSQYEHPTLYDHFMKTEAE